jgi:hypothetical protein
MTSSVPTQVEPAPHTNQLLFFRRRSDMLSRFNRAASLALVAAAAVASAAPAIAADDNAPRVEYRYLGQGAYVLVLPAQATQQPPYALTGRTLSLTPDSPLRAGTVINTGQGRYIVPANR